MKMCPNCRNQIADEAVYCPICGNGIGISPQFTVQQTPPPQPDYSTAYQQPPIATPPVPYVDPFDHTDKFDAADVSENKVLAMLVYLLGPLGVIIALLAASASKYVAFHVRQALKLTVVDILAALSLSVFVFLTAMVGMEGFGLFIAGLVGMGLFLIKVICFFQICKGQAKEAYFVRNLNFLN